MQSVSYEPLSPLRFLERAAEVLPSKTAIVYGSRRITYAEMAAEATRLAHALRAMGVERGDRVAWLVPNVPETLVAHFAVPLIGAVLVAINTRLAPQEVEYICEHSGSQILFVDAELQDKAAALAEGSSCVREIVTLTDPLAEANPAERLPGSTYEEVLARGSDEPLPWSVPDEGDLIAINYTSGTTGQPKGVMYNHRGAYLNSLGEILHSGFSADTRYLWTLPMFHANGWCTTWGVTAVGATHVCLRAVRGAEIWRLVDAEEITHLNGAPTVLTTIAASPEAAPLKRPLTITTAGAPPSPTILSELDQLGARTVHVYGLTETYGPVSVCEWQPGWEALDGAERARLLSRQGVGMLIAASLRVVDEQMNDVPADGETMGEIVMRGNSTMVGYFDDEAATAKAFAGGWFHSGDLGVMHPDGYVELRDRAKDIIISGGENISTVEVEQAVVSHEAVLEAAIIGVPDPKWGERPKAFVVLRPGADVSEQDLIAHVCTKIARYKAPAAIAFMDDLPKTSTGKVQKFELREREWAGHETRIQG